MIEAEHLTSLREMVERQRTGDEMNLLDGSMRLQDVVERHVLQVLKSARATRCGRRRCWGSAGRRSIGCSMGGGTSADCGDSEPRLEATALVN